MKKIISVFLSIIAAAGLCFGVAGCKQLTEQEKLEKEIIREYINYYNLDDKWEKDTLKLYYYGENDGAHAIFMKGGIYCDVMTYDSVGAAYFTYPSGNKMKVYKDKKFYSLSEAFKQGFFDNDTIREIANTHYEDNVLWSECLTAEQESEIKTAFFNTNKLRSTSEGTANDVIVSGYYGKYEDCYAVSVGWERTGNEILIYSNGEFYSIDYSVENGLITEKDKRNIFGILHTF